MCRRCGGRARNLRAKRGAQALRGRIDALQKRLAASEETKSEAVDALRESERAISETNRTLREASPGSSAEVDARLAELQSQSRALCGRTSKSNKHVSHGCFTSNTPAVSLTR